MRSWAPCLGHRDFRIYYAGQLVNWFGNWTQQIALGWWAYKLGGSVGWLAAMAVCAQLPTLALGPWAATLADHVERRGAMIATQALSLAQAALLLALYVSGRSDIWMLLGAALFLGVVNAFDIPLRQSYQAHLVPERDVSNAVAICAASANFMRLAAPALAGLVIGIAGVAACFAINCASYLAILWTLRKLPSQEAAARRVEGVSAWSLFSQGARHAFDDPWIVLALSMALALSLFATSYLSMMPALAQGAFKTGPELYGIAMGMSGLGAMLAGVAMAARPRWMSRRIMAWLGAIGSLALCAMSRMPDAYWAMPMLFLTGFGLSGAVNIANALIQRRVDPAMRGRVLGMFSMCLYGAAPIGAIAMGTVAELRGTRDAIALGAAMAAISCLAVAWRARGLLSGEAAARAHAESEAEAALSAEQAWAVSMSELPGRLENPSRSEGAPAPSTPAGVEPRLA